ncbi:protein RIK-like [Papaver somniferum]|uniref:protein RIK-like n=1 Tax=Papaver somniferum TaxID=3469 RepID=UPI000E70518F|nr:protein RIK-like [Papaver somniferum]
MTDQVYSEESINNSSGVTRQRKKRKWDQPAESFISAGLAVPLNNIGTIVGLTLPGVTPVSTTYSAVPHIFQAPIQQSVASVVQNLNLPKIQDELIAREIVINDAEPTVRYKLTKRQTQEEIQRCTGAVVITRGKYRPPNALNDSEKPLYLHISAGAHLKETAERIVAVDSAASMIEEMLKPGVGSHAASTPFHSIVNSEGQVTQQLETCVFLGFNTDPSLNIAARIRGPNDQYINHIMNATGANVLLRGRGSGNLENPQIQESQQPLHLYLSSINPKSLEDAKLLAENLLDTISVECGTSRVSSSKAYNAVPPPQQLLAGVQSSGNEQNENGGVIGARTSSSVYSTPVAPQVSAATLPGMPCVHLQGSVSQNVGSWLPSTTTASYPQPAVSSGTSYSGYGGIYPQATPLQQVALALRQSPYPVASVTTPSASAGNALSKPSSNPVSDTEKRRAQRRKFQELPVVPKCPAKPHQNSPQGSEFVEPGAISDSCRNVSNMPPPKKLVQSSSNGMPPPSSSMAMPPPPTPKFTVPKSLSQTTGDKNATTINPTSGPPVPDTLTQLMEYGDEDDEDENLRDDSRGEQEISKVSSKSMAAAVPKPFWAP